MKKVVKKTTQKESKKEKDFEVIARLVQNGFERVDEKLNQMEEKFNKRFDFVDNRFEAVNSQLFSINHELKEHTVRLDSLERKQSGVLASLDETVHISEFKILTKRVDKLEKK